MRPIVPKFIDFIYRNEPNPFHPEISAFEMEGYERFVALIRFGGNHYLNYLELFQGGEKIFHHQDTVSTHAALTYIRAITPDIHLVSHEKSHECLWTPKIWGEGHTEIPVKVQYTAGRLLKSLAHRVLEYDLKINVPNLNPAESSSAPERPDGERRRNK